MPEIKKFDRFKRPNYKNNFLKKYFPKPKISSYQDQESDALEIFPSIVDNEDTLQYIDNEEEHIERLMTTLQEAETTRSRWETSITHGSSNDIWEEVLAPVLKNFRNFGKSVQMPQLKNSPVDLRTNTIRWSRPGGYRAKFPDVLAPDYAKQGAGAEAPKSAADTRGRAYRFAWSIFGPWVDNEPHY